MNIQLDIQQVFGHEPPQLATSVLAMNTIYLALEQQSFVHEH